MSEDRPFPVLALPVVPPYAPMEAKTVKTLPEGEAWQFEPKWDGFRCLAFRDGDRIALQSKAGQPLGRYFPELLESLGELRAARFVLDGEIVIPTAAGGLSFDDLLQRIHPAESRVRKLAAETPCQFHVFDLLVDEKARSLVERPLAERRLELERFAREHFPAGGRVHLVQATRDRDEALAWEEKLRREGFDGMIAKRTDLPYQAGERTGMQKCKWLRTADCVVGAFRYAAKEKIVGSLLLGLYDAAGVLHHVGFTSSIARAERVALTPKLEALRKPPGFTGRSPGGPSRWSTERSGEFEPLDPVLVVEVQWDHWSGGRFRHGTKLLRWRPDKAPLQCTMDQVPAQELS